MMVKAAVKASIVSASRPDQAAEASVNAFAKRLNSRAPSAPKMSKVKLEAHVAKLE